MNTTPEVAKKSSDDKIAQLKIAAEKKFEIEKKSASDLTIKCNNIKITDETTLAMATQTLSQANEALKKIEAKGKELREPYTKASKMIIELEKAITKTLEASIEAGKLKLRAWNDEQEKIKKEADAQMTKEQGLLSKVAADLTPKIDQAATPERCQELIDSINAKFPDITKFKYFSKEALESKNRFIDLLKLKKTSLEKILEGGKGTIEAFAELKKQEIETAKATEEATQSTEDKKEAIAATIALPTSKFRKLWTYSIEDEKALPAEFLSPDPKKIKAYLDANKETFKDGHIFGGVKFYIDKSPSIR